MVSEWEMVSGTFFRVLALGVAHVDVMGPGDKFFERRLAQPLVVLVL